MRRGLDTHTHTLTQRPTPVDSIDGKGIHRGPLRTFVPRTGFCLFKFIIRQGAKCVSGRRRRLRRKMCLQKLTR